MFFGRVFSHCLVINADLGRGVIVIIVIFFNHVLFNCILSPLLWMFHPGYYTIRLLLDS